jgi:hypothetical protein
MLSALAPFLALAAPGDPAEGAAQRMRYRETVSANVRYFDIWREPLPGGFRLLRIDGLESAEYLVDSESRTRSYTLSRLTPVKETAMAVREGDALRIEGVREGKRFEKIGHLDEAPWVAHAFLFGAFAMSAAAEQKIWMVQPLTRDIVKLKLTREAMGPVPGNPGETNAVVVRLSAPGFPAAWWSCRYWFRSRDGLLLRGEETRGMPGTARFIIDWQGEP